MPVRARTPTPVTDLDIKFSDPKYFTVGAIAAGSTNSLQDSWTLTLTRMGASAGYGAYTVTFNEQGYDNDNSTIKDQVGHQPDADLIGDEAAEPPRR